MASAPLKVRSPLRRLGGGLPSRLLAATIACSFAIAPSSVLAATTQESEIERLYVEGQDKYASGDFSGAADAWTRLLERLPEAQANRATRENVLLNVLQAHLDGYARTRLDDGSKDIGHLRSGNQILETYFADFKKAYGDRAAVSAAVQEKADEIENALEEAEAAAVVVDPDPDPDPDPNPNPNPNPDDRRPDIIVLEAENDGGGLIVGGAVSAGLSLAGFGILAAGAVLANRAEADYLAAAPDDDDARTEAEQDGATGNALTITGAIVGPVLLITGGVLIGLGIVKRKNAKANREDQIRRTLGVVPTGSRGFGGLMLHGRF